MLLRPLIISVILFSIGSEALCDALTGPSLPCEKQVMIAIDASNYMKDANLVNKTITFVAEKLMPKWNVQKKTLFSFSLNGLYDRANLNCRGYVTYGQSSQEMVCNALDNFRDSYRRGVLNPITLIDITTDISNCTILGEGKPYDLVILFTANSDQSDINRSAWFSQRQKTIIVNLANGDFSSWISPGGATVLCDLLDFDDLQANRILDASCGKISGEDECLSVTTSTQAPPISRSSGPIPTVPDDQISLCGCNIETSWNDIMIVADSSSAMGSPHFNELQDFVQSALSGATIGQAERYQTRVGVVSYADTAKLVASLTKYEDTLGFLNDDWPFIDGDGTNILSGIEIALDELNSNAHRSKSRKVIVLGASTFRESAAYKFPTNQTQTFKRNNGVIIVIAYGDIHGISSSLLQDVASTGFYINATQGAPEFSVLRQLICDANCFCPMQERVPEGIGYFPVTRSGESWPSLGCYWNSELTSIQMLVNRTCHHLTAAPGTPTMPKTLSQQMELYGGIPLNVISKTSKPGYYLGLTQKTPGEWVWDDGTPYAGNVISGDGNCAYLQQGSGFNLFINATDCQSGFYYSCQTVPCTSEYFC